jgi:hypothetical protein
MPAPPPPSSSVPLHPEPASGGPGGGALRRRGWAKLSSLPASAAAQSSSLPTPTAARLSSSSVPLAAGVGERPLPGRPAARARTSSSRSGHVHGEPPCSGAHPLKLVASRPPHSPRAPSPWRWRSRTGGARRGAGERAAGRAQANVRRAGRGRAAGRRFEHAAVASGPEVEVAHALYRGRFGGCGAILCFSARDAVRYCGGFDAKLLLQYRIE